MHVYVKNICKEFACHDVIYIYCLSFAHQVNVKLANFQMRQKIRLDVFINWLFQFKDLDYSRFYFLSLPLKNDNSCALLCASQKKQNYRF